MAGTCQLSTMFQFYIEQLDTEQQTYTTAPLTRGGTIMCVKVDVTAIAGGTTLQMFKVAPDGTAISFSAGTMADPPTPTAQNIGGAAWSMAANTTQFLTVQEAEATSSFAVSDRLRITTGGANCQIKVTFFCRATDAYRATVTATSP